jgi:hypothetical protein
MPAQDVDHLRGHVEPCMNEPRVACIANP